MKMVANITLNMVKSVVLSVSMIVLLFGIMHIVAFLEALVKFYLGV